MKAGGSVAGGKGITVFVTPDKDYASQMKAIVSSASSSYKRICYVSLNKPYPVVSDSLKKQGMSLEKFFFIDCTGKSREGSGQVVYVSSPKALTEMSITIGKVLEMGKIEALIFDSLSTLLVYADASTVVKFTNSLISMLRSKGVAGFLTCLKGGIGSDIVKDISMFADKVVGGQ